MISPLISSLPSPILSSFLIFKLELLSPRLLWRISVKQTFAHQRQIVNPDLAVDSVVLISQIVENLNEVGTEDHSGVGLSERQELALVGSQKHDVLDQIFREGLFEVRGDIRKIRYSKKVLIIAGSHVQRVP